MRAPTLNEGIYERLGLTGVWTDYATLACIARARGHAADAAAWEQKRDALLAELRRRAGAPALPQQTIQAITQLALLCAQMGHEHAPLGAAGEEVLATISTWPAPLDALVPFLRALAAGAIPSLPQSLPRELRAPLAQILDAARQVRTCG